MKNLKIKLGLFSLLAILAASVFFTACEQESIITDDINIIEQESLSKTILDLPEIKNFDEKQNGELLHENIFAVHTSVDESGNNKFSIFGIPIKSSEANTVKDLYIIYDYHTSKFEFSMYQIEYGDEFYQKLLMNNQLDIAGMTEKELSDIGLTYSAKETILSLEGEAIVIKQYQNNALINSVDNIEEKGFLGYFCMLVCIVDKMSIIDKITCSAALAACYIAPSATCAWGALACAGLGQEEWNDCYNNNCFVQEQCGNPTVVQATNISGNGFTLNWNGTADYYWLYYWSNGWQYFASVNNDPVRITAPSGNWCIAVEAVCGHIGKGIGPWDCANVALIAGENTIDRIQVLQNNEVK